MARSPKVTDIFSHWSAFVEGFQGSTLDFYTRVEEAIRERQMTDYKTSRVDWREGGILSAKREYLRVRRKEFAFDICGAPFGNGFFFSSWLGEIPSGFWALVSLVPVLGLFLRWAFRRETYYRIDTAEMFRSLVHDAVVAVVDSMTTQQGLRPLTELERKPIMREFFRR
jgi:hypothetical protein